MKRYLSASVTCFAFAWAVLWPDVARARDAAPPPAAPAAPDPVMLQAKQHFEAGRAAYGANDLPTAIREFKAAEALRPSPILAYNIGLANEKMGRRRVAVRYYKRYLEGQPNAANRAEVDGRINALEHDLATSPQGALQGQAGEQSSDNPPPPPPPDPNAPPIVQGPSVDPYAPVAPVMPAQPRKRRSLWWVGLVVGLSVAVVVTVVVLAVVYTRNDTVYAYDAKVPLSPLDRSRMLDNAALPSTARGASTAPVLQVHF